jgi:hypothetical protein
MTVLKTVTSYLKALVDAFNPELQRQHADEAFLAEATDRIDLEMKLRFLDQQRVRGLNPWRHYPL